MQFKKEDEIREKKTNERQEKKYGEGNEQQKIAKYSINDRQMQNVRIYISDSLRAVIFVELFRKWDIS